MNWRENLRRFWFGLKTLSLRGRFFFGKASAIEADIRETDSNLAEVYDEYGKPLGRRLLSRYGLATRTPRTGTQGWNLFEQSSKTPGVNYPVALECSYCGHLFVILVRMETDPLSAGLRTARPLGTPVSCASEWFSFTYNAYQGDCSLSCTHCEQTSRPQVSVLS